MPTLIYYRHWCKTCNDWKLFRRMDWKNEALFCETCDMMKETVFPSEILAEKLVEQRERYKQKKREEFAQTIAMMGAYGHAFLVPEMKIIECDAGQMQLDEYIKKKKEDEQVKKKLEVEKYRHVGRNEACLCGSGLKYKKCCLSKIQSYR